MSTEFIDYYELMQISPNAEKETIQRVFRLLAARFHPDNPQTGEIAKFVRLNEAYNTLIDDEQRACYDLSYYNRRYEPNGLFSLKEFTIGIEGEKNRRMGILCLLYKQRRTDPESPGLSVLDLENVMSFPREHLMFTLWYLKEKQWIRQNEQSDFMITGDGVDHIESNLPGNEALYKLLKAAESGSKGDHPAAAEFEAAGAASAGPRIVN